VLKKRTRTIPPDALLGLFDETVALFHRLNSEAERIHEHGALSAALRGILRGLRRHGAQTVPNMARMRPVSRQHVQELVNRLRELGLVEYTVNPAHKRSQLVRLTTEGAQKIDEMEVRERRLLSRLDTGHSPGEIERATGILKGVRSALESSKWQKQMEKRKH
jgi:DNA-binding MarR family transcriptional regulator